MTPCVVEKDDFFSGYKSLHRSIRTGFFNMIIEFLKYISFKFTWLSEREVLNLTFWLRPLQFSPVFLLINTLYIFEAMLFDLF